MHLVKNEGGHYANGYKVCPDFVPVKLHSQKQIQNAVHQNVDADKNLGAVRQVLQKSGRNIDKKIMWIFQKLLSRKKAEYVV